MPAVYSVSVGIGPHGSIKRPSPDHTECTSSVVHGGFHWDNSQVLPNITDLGAPVTQDLGSNSWPLTSSTLWNQWERRASTLTWVSVEMCVRAYVWTAESEGWAPKIKPNKARCVRSGSRLLSQAKFPNAPRPIHVTRYFSQYGDTLKLLNPTITMSLCSTILRITWLLARSWS